MTTPPFEPLPEPEIIRAFAFTFKFVGHGIDPDDALRDVCDNTKVRGLEVDEAHEIEDLGPINRPMSMPWAIYSPTEQGWWSDDFGWGHLDTARRFDEDAPSRSDLVTLYPDATWVRVGNLP